MNETQLLQRLADANAYSRASELPEQIWTADLALREIERRIGMSQNGRDTKAEHRRSRPPLGDVPVMAKPASPSTVGAFARSRVGLIAAIAAVAVIAASVLLIGGEQEGLIAGQPPGPLDEYVAALQANDSAAALVVLSEDVLPGFSPWLVGNDTSGFEVSNCEIRNAPTGFVVCDVDLGPNFFYSRIGGPRETTLWANVQGPTMELIDIFNPDANAAGSKFRTWMAEYHPDRYSELFDDEALHREKSVFTEEAGRLQFEFLDEYLAYLADQG